MRDDGIIDMLLLLLCASMIALVIVIPCLIPSTQYGIVTCISEESPVSFTGKVHTNGLRTFIQVQDGSTMYDIKGDCSIKYPKERLRVNITTKEKE